MNKKLLIVLLVLLGVLFVIGVGSNAFDSGGTDSESALASPIVKSLNNLLISFVPKLESRRLSIGFGSGCSKNNDATKISLKSNCKIIIDKKKGEPYEAAILEFPPNVVAKVFNPKDKKNSDLNCIQASSETYTILVGGKQKMVTASDTASTILVNFSAKDSDSNGQKAENFLNRSNSICWKKADENKVNILALEEGGILEIYCLACEKQGLVSVEVK